MVYLFTNLFLSGLRSKFWIFLSTLHSLMHKQRGAITAFKFVTLGIDFLIFKDNYI